jgi:hypothetical protein
MADFYYTNLSGMNRSLNPLEIKPGDFKLVLNYNSDITGAKKKRDGYETFLNNPDSSEVYNMFEEKLSSGRFVLRVSGTSIYKYAFTGSTWGSAVKTGIGYVLNQKQLIGDTTGTGNVLDATTDYLAQGFQVDTTASCAYINLLLLKVGTPGTITIRIETDVTGSPSGTLVNANATATIAASALSTSANWNTVNFTAFTLTASTQYHIVIRPSATSDGSNYVQWLGSTSNVYANGSLKISTNSGSTWAATSTTLDAGFIVYLQTKCRMGHTVLYNKMILGNGGDYSMQYDGVTFANVTEAPRAKYWLTYKGRVYAFGVDYAPSRGFFCKTADLTSWTNDPDDVTTGNWFDIDNDYNGDVTGAEVIDDRIIVHKQYGSYRLVPDEFGRVSEILPIPTMQTAASHYAISKLRGVSLYPSRNGVYGHQGVTPTLISKPIEDLYQGIVQTKIKDLCSGTWRDHYYLSAMGSVTEGARLGGGVSRVFTNAVFVYNSLLNEWYLYSLGHQPTAFGTWLDSSDIENMYFGDSLGNTFKFGTGTLDGTLPIHAEFEFWPINLGIPDRLKDFDRIGFITDKGMESELLYNFDGDDFSSLGSLSESCNNRLLSDVGGGRRNIAFKVVDSSKVTGSVVYGVSISASAEDFQDEKGSTTI